MCGTCGMGATEAAIVSVWHPRFGLAVITQHHLFDDDWFVIDRADPLVLFSHELVKLASVGCRPDGRPYGWGLQRVKTCRCDADMCMVHIEGSLLKFRDAADGTAVYRLTGRYPNFRWWWIAEWAD